MLDAPLERGEPLGCERAVEHAVVDRERDRHEGRDGEGAVPLHHRARLGGADGEEGRIATLTLGDETGRVEVALFDEKADAIAEIEEQIEQQGGTEVLSGLEEQYDAFTRGAAESLLASDEDLPSGDELADQFEQFLARQRKNDQG